MKKLFILICLLNILLFGCSSPRICIKNFEFDDLGNMIDNEQYCFKLCKQRESKSYQSECNSYGSYTCAYEPVICENGRCLCKTY